ncbi:FtsW/RodA/SpoVE family cell cycle protein [Anaerolentibacter hominis]|uniref:FtsW/RodA/SpoVE family cell cycle protein n=1 Tax=Anaerolentibacter hominis TaxID=3079009 RepID=UPI0031B83267
MENIIVQLSTYIFVILITIYTLYCFTVFRRSREQQNKVFRRQRMIMYTIHFLGHLILYMNTGSLTVAVLYALELLMFIVMTALYQRVYKNLSRLVLNNMLFLLSISFIMLTRLNVSYAKRQLAIATGSLLICLVVPVIIDRFKVLRRFGWFYAAGGLCLLLLVFVFGVTKYGATNWVNIAGFVFQPSEVVKIVFVFFAAALLAKSTEFIDVVKVTVVAAVFVMVLVVEKDLGAALLYFTTYLIILYVASSNALYLFAGLGAGSAAAVVAYKLFAHVRVRVVAWKDPWGSIDNEGFQVAQSLLAIGSGGWFGMGLGKGLPTSIPVVESDFVFSAVAEEFGTIFAVCLILISLSCFLMFVNIGMKLKQKFYKLVALGLSTVYIFQVFLTIGGATKFIPSTGVTLPLVSYGGSSIISTIIIFSVIQGLYVLNQDEEAEIESEENEAIEEEYES